MENAGSKSGGSRLLFGVVLPALGLLVLLVFIATMLFVGFARIDLECARDSPTSPPTCRIRESRLLGLYDRRETVPGVTGVGYGTQDVDTRSRVTLSSTVLLQGSAGPVELTRVVSNVGGAWKADTIARLRAFLEASDRSLLAVEIYERNVFGWVGAAGAALLVLSAMTWSAGRLRRPRSGRGRMR